MGNTKGSGSNPDPPPNNATTDWNEVEYREFSEDWRHRDRLIWATLPVAATVAAVIVGVAYRQIPDDALGLVFRLCLLLVGVFLTVVMLISLIRHRMYQKGSQEQIRSLQIPPDKKDCDTNPRKHLPSCDFVLSDITKSEKFDAALTNWARLSGGFKWIVRGTLIVMAGLVVLAAITFGQLILLILKLILN